MKKCRYATLLISCLFFALGFAADTEEVDNVNILEQTETPIYVSLGSVCEACHILKACNLRKAAFPFDWITTIDSEKFLEILEDDFRYFLDDEYLYGVETDPGPLLNTHYHVEFLHEGDFRAHSYAANMLKLKSKYQRRIERFRSLAGYPGKVVFLRTAYAHSMTDPHRYYTCADNLEITDDYAWKLYDVLNKRFPVLDFTLVIINNNQRKDEQLVEEKRLTNNLIKVRTSISDPALERTCFTKFFTSLSLESGS